MAEAKKSAGSKPKSTASAKAAAKEKDPPAERSVEVRGRKFDLPQEAPFGMVFAASTARKAELEGDEEGMVFALIDVAGAYVGNEALQGWLGKMTREDGSAALMELLEAIREEYGAGPGESSASPTS